MRRPSVLFMNRVYPPQRGATGRVLRDLARSFAREGWQVTVVTTGSKTVVERDGGVKVIRLKSSQNPGGIVGYFWIWLRMLIKALRLRRPHLLVTMSDPPLLILIGQIIKTFKGCRHVNWCHDLYPDILPVLNVKIPDFILNFFKALSRRAMKKADKVIVIGRCMARQLTYDGVDPRHITMIPNWPDFELSAVAMTRKNGLNGASQEILPVNGSKPHEDQLKTAPKFRVLYAGNIGLAHPIDTILGAAEILNEDHPEIEFVFVGDGPRFDDIAEERIRRGLDNIRLMPYQPVSRLRQVMESGDVHLISIKEEAAGMLVPCKLYAALAVNRPCIFIGPAHSEAAKVIKDFKAGGILPQGAPEELARQIRHYRMNSRDWFDAHNGAVAAGQIFMPGEAINAWIERAWGVVEQDIRAA